MGAVAKTSSQKNNWSVYVLLSESSRTYVGITTDLARRLKQHNGDLSGGGKYTRSYRPWRINGHLSGLSRSEASTLEVKLKKLNRNQKLAWPSDITIPPSSNDLRKSIC